MKKGKLYLCVRMNHLEEGHVVTFEDVEDGLEGKIRCVCDVDEVTFFQCARMVLDGTLLEKDYDPFWHYCLSYAYCRLREINTVSYKEYYETCKSILRLFKDNWLGCDDAGKQRKYDSALEFLEGWKAEIEKMDVPDPSLLFKAVPKRRKTNTKGWDKLFGALNSESGNMKGWEKLLGQKKEETEKAGESTVSRHILDVLEELRTLALEQPQEVAEIMNSVKKTDNKSGNDVLNRLVGEALSTPPASGIKPKTTKQKPFRDLIQYHDKDKLLERLHYLIDNKGGALVGAVLLNAYHINPYLMRKPTRGEFESEFKLIGSWSAIYNYLDDNNPVAVEKANKIVLFPDD